jgi:hypothetical protein
MTTRQQVLDLYFMDARRNLLETPALWERWPRGGGAGDFRLEAFRRALAVVGGEGSAKAEGVLMSLSDLSRKPIEAATTKAACGAPPPPSGKKSAAPSKTPKPKSTRK